MGGGSRDDIQSLILLRPLAIFFIAYAYIFKTKHGIGWSSYPLLMLSLLILLIMIQIVPLPPEMWTQLPKRQIFADISTIAGYELPWRPITLSPSKTWNALFAMSVPLAAMLLFMNVPAGHKRTVLVAIMGLIAFNAAWGVFQTLGDARGPLYLYNVTNNGSVVGLFANRNHNSIILVLQILMLGWYSYILQTQKSTNMLHLSLCLGGIFVMIPLIFIIGSRSGLLLMLPALLISIYFYYAGTQTRASRNNSQSKPNVSRRNSALKNLSIRITNVMSVQNIILLLIVTMILAIAIGAIAFSRSLAFDRLVASDSAAGLRSETFEILVKMASDYLPFGSGFGSFEHVYKIYEPIALLSPTYFNQAHNDWLQIIIEGGLPAFVLLFLILAWFAKNTIFLLRNWNAIGSDRISATMCVAIFAVLAAASVGDYPLRVPFVMALSSIIAVYLETKIKKSHSTI